jgi:hypothetical protein
MILEIDMKQLMTTALILLLTGFQAVTVAQPSKASPPADRQAMHDEMQEKMASAKTDAERQQIMADQHKNAQTLHGPMHEPMHAHMGHSARGLMKGMPLGDAEHFKRMQSMHEQMNR